MTTCSNSKGSLVSLSLAFILWFVRDYDDGVQISFHFRGDGVLLIFSQCCSLEFAGPTAPPMSYAGRRASSHCRELIRFTGGTYLVMISDSDAALLA